jgi:quercetin dioxygenase-like cupin family protein
VSAKPKPYRTRVEDVPLVQGLREDEGWINMHVRFLIDQKSAGADNLVFGWTVMPPGASHERHRHFNADEFLVVMSGAGVVFTDEGEEPAKKGDVVYTPRGHWHGFRNDSDEEALLIWGWVGAGSLEAAGYEVPAEGSEK